jgi:hypothetical protein
VQAGLEGDAGVAPPGAVEAALKALEEEDRLADREHCRGAIADFLAVAERLGDSEEKAALVRIRQFRTQRLAHSLFDNEPDQLPRFADLFHLLGLAKEAAKHASHAVEGRNTDFDDLARDARADADGYYACVRDGLMRAAESS